MILADAFTTVDRVCAFAYKFTGKEQDSESGLNYFGARYMSSNLGRFMSPDWSNDIEAVPYANLENPQSLNLYSYLIGNPLRDVDTDGHGGCDGFAGRITVTLFGATGTYSESSTTTFTSCDTVLRGITTGIRNAQDRLSQAHQAVSTYLNAPRNQGCMNMFTASGALAGAGIGTHAGAGVGAAGGFTLGLAGGGVLAVPGGVGGGIAGGAAGGVIGGTAGGAGGAALGYFFCASGSGGSGSGGSGGPGKQGKFWKSLKNFRQGIKTNGQSGKAQRLYEWDYTHGDVEVYNGRGEHLGSADPETGEMTKPAVPGRALNNL